MGSVGRLPGVAAGSKGLFRPWPAEPGLKALMGSEGKLPGVAAGSKGFFRPWPAEPGLKLGMSCPGIGEFAEGLRLGGGVGLLGLVFFFFFFGDKGGWGAN